nr:unnamed protein product [Callosobruchus chinensis]
MDLLTSRLKSVFHVQEAEQRLRILGCCAKYHSHIVKLALEVNKLHMHITGHMALVWAVSMGCITNQLLSKCKPVGAILYLLGYFMGLSCFVVPGQTLQTEVIYLFICLFANSRDNSTDVPQSIHYVNVYLRSFIRT